MRTKLLLGGASLMLLAAAASNTALAQQSSFGTPADMLDTLPNAVVTIDLTNNPMKDGGDLMGTLRDPLVLRGTNAVSSASTALVMTGTEIVKKMNRADMKAWLDVVADTDTTLATDDQTQDAEERVYDMNTQNLKFQNGQFSVETSAGGRILSTRLGDIEGGLDARVTVGTPAVGSGAAVDAQSTLQASSNANGNGLLAAPWLYASAIEAPGERGLAGTAIVLGDDGNVGSDDTVSVVTNGETHLKVFKTGQVGIPAYNTTSFPANVTTDRILTVNPTDGMVKSLDPADIIGDSDTHLGSHNLTATANRLYDIDGHMLTFKNGRTRWHSADSGLMMMIRNEASGGKDDARITIGGPKVAATTTGGEKDTESIMQAASEMKGKGLLAVPWVYTTAIEAPGERGNQSTAIVLGSSNDDDPTSAIGTADTVSIVTDGETRIRTYKTGQVGFLAYKAAAFPGNTATDRVLTIDPDSGLITSVNPADLAVDDDTNLATDDLTQDAGEARLYNMNTELLTFRNGTFRVQTSGAKIGLRVRDGEGGEFDSRVTVGTPMDGFGTEVPNDAQSVMQAASGMANRGSLSAPWIYATAIEAPGERQNNSTAIILGASNTDSPTTAVGRADTVSFVTEGSTRVRVYKDGQVGFLTYNATTFPGNAATDRILTIDPADGLVRSVTTASIAATGSAISPSTNHGNQSFDYNDAAGDPQNFDASNAWREVVSKNSSRYGTADDIFFTRGNVNIGGNTAPSTRLKVTGEALITGGVSQTSDRRLKTDIVAFDGGLDAIMDIEPVTYLWKNPEEHAEGEQLGFIAQDVLAALPEAVQTMEDEMGTLTVSDRPILAAAIGAVQELNAEVETLKAQLETMEMLELAVMNMQSQLNALAEENAVLKANFEL